MLVTLFAAIAAGPVLSACSRRDDGTSPRARELPPLVLRDDTPDLLLTYLDERGDFFTVMRIDDVPHERRDQVRVVVTTRTEGASGDLLYVADLRQKRSDGSYEVTTITRATWEERAASRRRPKAAAPPSAGVPPQPPAERPPGPAAGGARVVVHIYGASWCGPCHDAQAHLQRRGVAVAYHDVESEPGAGEEMRRKLASAGVRGGSIPVIDVAGRVLVGFDPRALDAAVAEASRPRGTTL